MEQTVKKLDRSKLKCNSKILREMYRKNYIKQLILEELLNHRWHNEEEEEYLNSKQIWVNTTKHYTFDLMYNAERCLSDECLQELHMLNMVDMIFKDNEYLFLITEEGIDAVKSFNIQSLAISSFSNYVSYKNAYWTKIIAIVALLVSIIALLFNKSCA